MIEQIFGVLRQKFCILHLAPEYNLDIQAHILAVLAAIHNLLVTMNLVRRMGMGIGMEMSQSAEGSRMTMMKQSGLMLG